jgi:hypothetical protein
MTGAAERTRRYRERFRHDEPVTKPKADNAAVDALQKEVTALKARILDLEDANAALRGALAHERKQHAAAAKPKAEKPPLPPDEARERIIKGHRTRVRNLEAKMRSFYARASHGHMPRETRTAIDWVLQPDQRRNATEAHWDRAVKGWNAWKNASDKARRRPAGLADTT